MDNIKLIASKLNLRENDYELFGKYSAKLDLSLIKKNNSNLVLVTSINPTKSGEGKTTTVIGLVDALNKIGKNAIAVLREPSLGPVFGMKGGATGGGNSSVYPSDDINLHFTGDFHAITSANNLLCAVLDNHLYFGNELDIDENRILIPRCVDMNDRALRNIRIGINNFERDDKFVITAASPIMAILCLANSFDDLRNMLNSMCIAYSKSGKLIYAKDLGCVGAMMALLKNAFKPNLVQTLEGNPAIIHGGPFANIAHGCNSVVSTKMGMSLSDYTVVEAGFGSDLGAQKFFDIVCRNNDFKPKMVVVNVTIKSLKYNGGASDSEVNIVNIELLKKGISNMMIHVNNMKNYIGNVMVALNKFYSDSDEEIEYLMDYCKSNNILFAINDSYAKGSSGSIDFANIVVDMCKIDSKINYTYSGEDSIVNKIDKVCKDIYHASNIVYSDISKKKILEFENNGFGNFDICIAKTQYSLSDDSKKIGVVSDFDMHVEDIGINSGAKFIIVYMGPILAMPGLGRKSNYLNIDVDDDYNIVNIV